MSDVPLEADNRCALANADAAAEAITNDVLARINPVLSRTGGPYPLHAPKIDGNTWDYVKDCLDTGWVSSVGAWVDRFEDMLAEITGARRAVATVNGTAALHATLLTVGVKPGDEVLVPSFTFVATANAISYCGGTPNFVDCEDTGLGIDPVALEVYLDRIGGLRGDVLINRKPAPLSAPWFRSIATDIRPTCSRSAMWRTDIS
jgi:perosamine synthetase